MLNKKIEKTKIERLNLNITDIIMQLKKYNILSKFSSKEEVERWILELNSLEIHNILSLKVDHNEKKVQATCFST